MEIGFDIIGDLRLDPNESFNWENKATSLYCVITGNVTYNMRTLWQTLAHLSKFYQALFYIPGPLEYISGDDADKRTLEILQLAKTIPNLTVLYQNVVIIDGIAILGCNGWEDENPDFEHLLNTLRLDDIAYLNKSIDRLQKHLDVKKIFIVSSAVPKKELYFGLEPAKAHKRVHLDFALGGDTEHKVTHWAFGTYEKLVDTNINNVRYVNNPYYKKLPYWAKRITIDV
jgi:hypothetical protein